jgi:hypothetical protein
MPPTHTAPVPPCTRRWSVQREAVPGRGLGQVECNVFSAVEDAGRWTRSTELIERGQVDRRRRVVSSPAALGEQHMPPAIEHALDEHPLAGTVAASAVDARGPQDADRHPGVEEHVLGGLRGSVIGPAWLRSG